MTPTNRFVCAIVGILLAMVLTAAGAATTQPSPQNNLQDYIDRTTPLLQSVDIRNVGPEMSFRGIDAQITAWHAATSRPTTQPATQPTAKPGELLVVPLPSYKPTLGFGVNLMVGYVFPMDKNDAEQPPSTIGAMGMYTQNNSWATGLFGNLHIDEDRYRITGALITGQVNYDFFGVGTEAGEQGVSIPLHQRINGFMLEPLFELTPNWYLGPRIQYFRMDTTTDVSDLNLPPTIAAAFKDFSTTSSGLGAHLQADTRDNQFYPHKGSLFDAMVDLHDMAWGDSFNYQIYKLSYNHYLSLSQHQVIAVRGVIQDAAGNAPFYALPQMGRGPDLRGYRPGQFQDNLLLAAQAEYRLEITERFGVVGFGGVGEVAPNFGQLNSDQLLPSVGAGLRYAISEINHINLRLDAAWGREGWQGYLSIGEAF